MTHRSADQEVAALLSEAVKSPQDKALSNLKFAKKEVEEMLSATGSSIFDLCTNIKKAKTKDEVKAAFTKFNVVMRIFLEAAPTVEHDKLVCDSLFSVRWSEHLRSSLGSAASVPKARAV